ncbi:AraC family transcriptional regulator [Alteribacillus sp. HJP-4]|uniref:AraC family transcriptional regulator n=1 Tax=Alteribacillus sp. HJP-4 TaxID=2775394 RepID=UPI0035CD2683
MAPYLKTTANSPVEFVLGGKLLSTGPFTHMKRTINNYEIIIGIEEVLFIECDGVKYEVNPGDILMIQPDQLHAGYAESSPGLSFYWFHVLFPDAVQLLNEQRMDEEAKNLQSSPILQKDNCSIFLPVFLPLQRTDRIYILFNQLLDVASAHYYNRHAANFFATSLLIEISEDTISSFQYKSEKNHSDSNLSTILEWIRLHALEPKITTSTIAETFSYNRDYLSRMFKKEVGMNVKEYVHLLKLSKAKDLLVQTNSSIGNISRMVGISDERYFMRLFKKYEGMTPTEYRIAYNHIPLNKE